MEFVTSYWWVFWPLVGVLSVCLLRAADELDYREHPSAPLWIRRGPKETLKDARLKQIFLGLLCIAFGPLSFLVTFLMIRSELGGIIRLLRRRKAKEAKAKR